MSSSASRDRSHRFEAAPWERIGGHMKSPPMGGDRLYPSQKPPSATSWRLLGRDLANGREHHWCRPLLSFVTGLCRTWNHVTTRASAVQGRSPCCARILTLPDSFLCASNPAPRDAHFPFGGNPRLASLRMCRHRAQARSIRATASGASLHVTASRASSRSDSMARAALNSSARSGSGASVCCQTQTDSPTTVIMTHTTASCPRNRFICPLDIDLSPKRRAKQRQQGGREGIS
jgi:hypothetical protein